MDREGMGTARPSTSARRPMDGTPDVAGRREMTELIRTSLGLCGECIDNPDVDGECECAVDMRVCPGCDRGPLNDSEYDCGEDDCPPGR